MAAIRQTHRGVSLWLFGLVMFLGMGMFLRFLMVSFFSKNFYSGVGLTEKSSVPKSLGSPCLDINHATLEEWTQLPKLGPVLALRIIKARPFYALEDLLAVQGVGVKNWQSWRHWLCVIP